MTNAISITNERRQAVVSAAADNAAREDVFSNYTRRKAKNTLRHQLADLVTFAEYLADVKFYPSADDADERKEQAKNRAKTLQNEAAAWASITYGLAAGFVRWQLQKGYAIGTVNLKLSTIRKYAELAFEAGTIPADAHALIRTVRGYQRKEQKHVDKDRVADGANVRKGAKKAVSVSLDSRQVKALKTHPATPQGRRDALLMCILLDLGLRVGELALLEVSNFDLTANTLTFYRPKVDMVQTHNLPKDVLRAVKAWFDSSDAPKSGKLLRSSGKGGKLGAAGMTERAITKRVAELGKRIGIMGLSAHDLRHTWATRASRNKTDAFALQEAGGWNSLAMPRRYVETAKIANEGVNLGEE